MAALVGAGALASAASPVIAQQAVGVGNPIANVPRTAAMAAACKNGPDLTCQSAVVQAIDNARAAEGVRPMALPSDYASLNENQQLFVLADLERVDRGLPGFDGLSSDLDRMAQAGAVANNDPMGPSGASWGSNWAGGEASALLADYDWMYDDGPGSPNLDCTSANAGGCWAHRVNVLADYGTQPSLGTGVAKVNGVVSLTELFASSAPGALDYQQPAVAAPSRAKAAPIKATVVATVRPSVEVSPPNLQMNTKLGLSQLARLTIKSAKPFSAVATVSGDGGQWSVTSHCKVAKAQACELQVKFLGLMPGVASASVVLHLPGHTQRVPVSAFVDHSFSLGRTLTPDRLIALYRLVSM